MDYVERIAAAMEYCSPATAEWGDDLRRDAVREVLRTIAICGCKVVNRMPSEDMVDAWARLERPRPDYIGVTECLKWDWEQMFKAAPAYPGADDE